MKLFAVGALLYLVALGATAQLPAAPQPQVPAEGPAPAQLTLITGFADDIDSAAIPGATIVADGPSPGEHFTAVADEVGFFEIIGLKPGISYRVLHRGRRIRRR